MSELRPVPTRRLRACVEAWPDCYTGGYDPSCCRFPKSCSATVYDEEHMKEEDLEPVVEPAEVQVRMARVEYYDDGYHPPSVRRLDPGEETWNWYRELPEGLVAAYEQAKVVHDAAAKALTEWVDENKPEEIEPTWERT